MSIHSYKERNISEILAVFTPNCAIYIHVLKMAHLQGTEFLKIADCGCDFLLAGDFGAVMGIIDADMFKTSRQFLVC